MALIDDLKALLELEDETEADGDSAPRLEPIRLEPLPASFSEPPLKHISPEENDARAYLQEHPDEPLVGKRPVLDPRRFIGSWEAPELREAKAQAVLNPSDDVMVPPPPEKYKAAHMDAEGKLVTGDRDLDSARILAEASQLLRERQGVGSGGGKALRPASGEARASVASKSAPPGKAPPDTGKADLLTAIDKVAKPPEALAEAPAPAQGEEPDPVDKPGAGPPPPTPPPEAGGPLGALSKMVMGSSDPRTERLKAALEESARMKRTAARLRGMGRGADLALGTNAHRGQGDDLDQRADDVVRDAQLPTAFEQKNQRFDQDMRLRESAEGRAQSADQRAQHADVRAGSADTRAGAEEGRKAKGFENTQAMNDPGSDVSKNARASIEALYPKSWQKIPQEIREKFSANDVQRIFGEVSMKDFRAGLTAAGGTMDRFEERQTSDYNKSRIGDRTVSAVNNLMGRLDDKAPIQGFDAAKGWAQLQKVPVLGGLLSGAGNSAVRGTEMEGIAQDALSVMQQIALDTSGKVLNETEIRNIERRLGLAAGQGEDAFRRAMRREFDAIQAKADRDFMALSPGAKRKVEERGLRPKFGATKPDYQPKEKTPLGERARETLENLGLGDRGGADLGYGD